MKKILIGAGILVIIAGFSIIRFSQNYQEESKPTFEKKEVDCEKTPNDFSCKETLYLNSPDGTKEQAEWCVAGEEDITCIYVTKETEYEEKLICINHYPEISKNNWNCSLNNVPLELVTQIDDINEVDKIFQSYLSVKK